jgi:antitoxin (DNA-binding transcriptional repressor) of toxin-antitoxin stability system
MAITVSTTELAKHFGEYLARIRQHGERFILTKNHRPVAELNPVTASRTATWGLLRQALTSLPCDPEFADDLEAVNRADQPADNPWG